MQNSSIVGLNLSVNRFFYQYYFRDNTAEILGKDTPALLKDRLREYSLPFQFGPARSVLVVGAGTGQNVSAALRAGAESVDACDIDPVILTVGKKYNPDYSSPKVHLICDDARHYFAHCPKSYDIIVFGLLDSQTVAGQGASIRLDTYVYTRESFSKALSLLNPKGLVVLSFAASARGPSERLYATMKDAAGYPPICLADKQASAWGNFLFLIGDEVRSGRLERNVPQGFLQATIPLSAEARVLTDDWPYLYVHPRQLDMPYLAVVAEILLLSLVVGRRTLLQRDSSSHPSDWQLFFLGAAFLLLELHAISFLSLLYGSTWQTSAIVINSVLIIILLANVLVMKCSWILSRQRTIYLLLFATIAVNVIIPPDRLFATALTSVAAGYLVTTALTLLPLGIAGVIFASSISKSENPARGMAFNLFGALIGGAAGVSVQFHGHQGT